MILKYAVVCGSMVTAAVAVAGSAETTAPRPNILLILADDLGYNDVGFHGSPDIRTPNLDRLAAAGTTFSSAYVVHPFCGPSRMGLLSGRSPYKFGAPYNIPPNSTGMYTDQGIPVSETLISTVLRDTGYQTGLMGKWHMGVQPEHHPNRRGFDDFYGFLGGGILYFGPYRANNAKGNVWDYKRFPEHNGRDITTLTKDDYITDVLSDQGVRFIRDAADDDAPFFLFMSYNAPHTVLAAKDEDLALFPQLSGKRQIYAAMVYALDRGVGQIVSALKETGQYEDTLIVFLSDNGGRRDEGANNHPLRGSKGDATEGGYRTPMLFHWPNVVKADNKFDHPVTALDFFPTFCGLAGAEIPADKELDGKDIWPAFQKGTNPHQGEMLYTVRHRKEHSDLGARVDDWKLVRAEQSWQLFNLRDDIAETNDLSKHEQHTKRLSQMISDVRRLLESHTQPLWFDHVRHAPAWETGKMPNYGFDGKPTRMPETPVVKKRNATDLTKDEYVAREKAKWEEKGWTWNPEKVDANFAEIDVNEDGLASGRERKAWFAKRKASGTAK